MNIAERKYKIIEKLLKVETDEMLNQIEEVLEEDKLHPVLAELLEKSSKESEMSKGKSHNKVMSDLREKFLQ